MKIFSSADIAMPIPEFWGYVWTVGWYLRLLLRFIVGSLIVFRGGVPVFWWISKNVSQEPNDCMRDKRLQNVGTCLTNLQSAT
jgi:hypothetical protein